MFPLATATLNRTQRTKRLRRPRHSLLLAGLLLFVCWSFASAETKPYRILHVMSYHGDWQWNRDQLAGFKSAFKGQNVEYRVIELDTKRDSDLSRIAQRVAQAHALVDTWQPDLIYTNDDNAQKLFAERYVGSNIPLVFSGVNRDPSEYNFIGADNVTGVVEQEHFVSTVKLLQQLVPSVRKIAVIVDSDPTWKGVMTRMRHNQRATPGVSITDWFLARSFDEYKAKVLALQSEVDAIAVLGVFNLSDADGNNVDYQEVLRWTAEHSRLPDFAFWQSRIERGTLCAVKVSGFDQGQQAGRMAYQILVDKVTPDQLPIRSSNRGKPAISLARAKALGLNIDVDLLLSIEVAKDYHWSK